MKVRIKGVYPKRKILASGQLATYFYHRATNTRLPPDPSSPEFIRRVLELNAGPATPFPAERTVAHLIREYKDSAHFDGLAERTRGEYRRGLADLESILGPFPVADIRRSHVTAIRNKFAKTRPAWANAVVRICSTMLTYAVKHLQWIETNPCQSMDLPKGGNGQTPYTEAQIIKFRAANPHGTRARLTFEICLATAFRLSDAARVRVDQIREKLIALHSTKTDMLVCAVPTDELMRAFDAWEAASRAAGVELGVYALGGTNGKPLNRRTVTADMEAAFIASGFDEDQRTHALRYTAAIRLFELGTFSYEDIAEVTGHAMASMARKYCAKKRNAQARVGHINGFDRRV